MNSTTNRYTNCMLTVIAASLVLLVLQGQPFRTAVAGDPPKDPPLRVQVVGPVEVNPSSAAQDVVLVGISKKNWFQQEIAVRAGK